MSTCQTNCFTLAAITKTAPATITILTNSNMNVFDNGLQVLLQRSRLQLLEVLLVLLLFAEQLRLWAGSLRVTVGRRRPVQLGQKLLQVFKRILPSHVCVKVLFLLVVVTGVKVMRERGGGAGAKALAPKTTIYRSDRLPLALCEENKEPYYLNHHIHTLQQMVVFDNKRTDSNFTALL